MSFYDLTFRDTSGRTIKMSEFRGKVLLIVNTATECGLAPQFKELERLWVKYKNKGLVVIGFPCNQFGGQEPVSNEHMTETCQRNFGVTFPLTEKIMVNGDATHPVFKYLKQKTGSWLFGSNIKWNFTKFLISADAKTIERYAPTTKPAKMEKDILTLLAEK